VSVAAGLTPGLYAAELMRPRWPATFRARRTRSSSWTRPTR
jgi:hypothetical protein